jgi:type I site-specific restriction-modification system R (restriction) subunit
MHAAKRYQRLRPWASPARRSRRRTRTRDANTRAVFGDYIRIYDIARAVEDGATVPIYYEGRLAKLELSEAERPKIDPDFEEVTEGEEVERKYREIVVLRRHSMHAR